MNSPNVNERAAPDRSAETPSSCCGSPTSPSECTPSSGADCGCGSGCACASPRSRTIVFVVVLAAAAAVLTHALFKQPARAPASSPPPAAEVAPAKLPAADPSESAAGVRQTVELREIATV